MIEPRLFARSPVRRPRAASLLTAAALLAALVGCGRQDALPNGLEQLKQGNYKAALIELKNAVDQAPDSTVARLALADAMERTNDLPGAENQLRKALDKGADANAVVPRLAALLLDRNELEKLIREFKDRKLQSPEADSSLRAAVALAYLAQRRLPLAQEQLTQAKASTPMVALAQAQMHLANNERDQALKVLGGTQPGADTPWWVLRAIGRLAGVMGDSPTALATFKRAHEAAPWHVGLTGEYGEALFNAGQLTEAGAIRDQLKKVAPNHFWTHLLDASLLARAGRVDESLAAALKVLAVSPEHLPATLLAARAELSKGDRLMATKRLATIGKLHPSALAVLELQTQAYLQGNELDKALETVRRARVQAPKEPRLLALEAEATQRRGDVKRAAALFTELVALQPDKAGPLMSLAELKMAQGDRAGAATLLDRAGELGRTKPEVMDRLVATAIKLRDVPRARRLADEAVAALPDQAAPRLALAAVQAAQQDNAGAWNSTLAALDRDPAYAPALQALVKMARKPAELTEVMARHAKAADSKGAEDTVFLDYARLLRQAGQAPAAQIAVLEKGLRMRPESIALRNTLVGAYLREGDHEKALGVAQAGAAMSNASPNALELQAATYDRLGKTDQAVRAYRTLVAALPQRNDLKLRLAILEAGAGRKAEAATLLRAAITARPFEAQAYTALAQLTAQDNPTEALSIARQMSGRDELKLEGMLLEASVLATGKKYDEALQQLDKAAKAGAVPAAPLQVVTVLDQMDRRSAADEDMAALLKRHPKNLSVLTLASRRAAQAGQAGRSVELLKRAVEVAPSDPILLNDLAWAQVTNNQAADAIAPARKAAALLPDSPTILDTLGVALSRQGKHDEAVPMLRNASQMAPADASTKLHLVEALLAAGDRKGAQGVAQTLATDKLSPAEKARGDKLKAELAS